eukprot:TRINITY_DN68011_c0_g1_i1.p2 TRINITY_DN68011_c0_g1~~TRINITY_DN68011_c0_g1_i1.p2  ORF type:complete len:141 (-),score=36.06 TRINITY_DN68011_c0_g1_i1:232-654(-)
MAPKVVKKVKSKKKKAANSAVARGDVMMKGAGPVSWRKAARSAAVSAAQSRPAGETAEELKKRQATEWKAMKAEIVVLKKRRSKMPSKGGKDDRISVNKEIRSRMEVMRARHEAEFKAAGIDGSNGVVAGGGCDDSMNDL